MTQHKEPATDRSAESTRLYLVRHGQTTSNTVHALDTALPGAALTDLGREQGRQAGERLARDHAGSTPVTVFSSEAVRARQTAEEVVRGAGSHAVAGGAIAAVAEIPAGDLEMRRDEDAHIAYHRNLGEWMLGRWEHSLPGAGPAEGVIGPYVEALRGVLAAAGTGAAVAVVSHGAVSRLIAAFLGGVDPEWAYQAYLPNGHIIAIDVPVELLTGAVEWRLWQGRCRVVSWGEHGSPACS